MTDLNILLNHIMASVQDLAIAKANLELAHTAFHWKAENIKYQSALATYVEDIRVMREAINALEPK